MKEFVVAIHDSGEYFTYLEIKVTDSENIYVNLNENPKGSNPHSSLHVSGQLHYRHGKQYIFHPKQVDRKTISTGILHTSVRKGDGRKWNIPCELDTFDDSFIIEDNIITREFGFLLSVDFIITGTPPLGYEEIPINIFQQKLFDCSTFKITVSMFEVVGNLTI